MKKGIYRLFIIASGLLFATIVPAQNLPVLNPDPAIRHGVLPNGLTYYIATNPSSKGHADFALVQKVGTQTDLSAPGKAEAVAKAGLAALPRITAPSAKTWLSSHEVLTDESGLVNITSDATVFYFNDISLTMGKNVTDSTLLLLLDIVDRTTSSSDEFLDKWYAPSDQAIVVSGDVDAGSIISKLTSLSYMIPAKKSLPREEYKWEDTDTATFSLSEPDDGNISTVTVSWNLPRAPREYMNTVQPAIYERFVRELGYIVERRIRQDLERRNIPVAEVACHYKSSADGPGDEAFTTVVSLLKGREMEAIGALGRTFGSLDAAGASIDEYRIAREIYIQELSAIVGVNFKKNSDYVDRCVSAFLRNASLASPAEKLNLHVSRNVADTTQLRLFHDMASALIDESRNLYVNCEYAGGNLTVDQVRNKFYAAWSDSYSNPSSLDAFYEAPDFKWPGYGDKVKLTSSKIDPMSGATIWTYSNGFRVAYKKMATSGKTYWTMALNGGYGSIDDLAEGEGAYIADCFELCDIAGVDGRTFNDMLLADGMTMEVKVGLTATLFTGVSPKENTEKAIQTLVAISDERTPDIEAFNAYKKSEQLRMELLRGSRQSRMAAVDSIICPDYRYSWMKSPGKLTDAVMSKADVFYTRQADKMNDGILILVSDMDEAEIKKLLANYVGAFRTVGSAFRRPSLRYQPVSGASTYTVQGDQESIDVVMSASMPLTMDNYMTAAVSAIVMEQFLSGKLLDSGMYPKVTYNFLIAPQERLSMVVSATPVKDNAFLSSEDPAGLLETLAVVRGCIAGSAEKGVSDALVNSSKQALKSYLADKMKGPLYWNDAIAKRFLDGKDFTTSYAARIDAVNAEKVRQMIAALNGGTKVEFVVNR